MNKYTAYIITGPTASGKSTFAHELAKRVHGAIINADSVQIYRGIENISASPFAGRAFSDEIDGVPYRLFSVLNLDKQISVADYIKMAHEQYDSVRAGGYVPIFVGGTGFYINGIVNGISPIPDVSESNRNKARTMVLENLNAARAMVPKCNASDPQRVARALEVFLETGRDISYWQALPRIGALNPTPFKILINPSMDELRTRIAMRIPEMISGGAMGEAEYIAKNDFDVRRAIGAEQLCEYLRGKISHDMAIKNWITKTNQYAKRQRTWFKTQFNADLTINHVPDEHDLDILLK